MIITQHRIFATRARIPTVLGIFGLAAIGGLALGPLNPPSGAVVSTNKTLAEVEPRIAVNTTNTPGDGNSRIKITQPGSYYLTSNITGVAGKHGIEIASSGVTLDLNGFDLVGVPAMGNFDGVIVTESNLTNITILNGSVRDWGGDGVDFGSASDIINCRVEGVLASGNAGIGISIGIGSTITKCSAYANGDIGISTSVGCTISNCTAYQNTSHGISCSQGATITDCTAYSNTDSGIFCGSGGTIAGCTTRLNQASGIQCGTGFVIRGNTCSANGIVNGSGIRVTGIDNRIEGNTCTVSRRGIEVSSIGNFIIRNTCSANVTNWDIAANNVCGPIIDRTVPASAAILGNSGPSSLGTTDPNSNFTY